MFKNQQHFLINSFSIAMLAYVLCAYTCNAQDTIVKRSDEKILAKILEVNPNEVKYKRFDYQNGPVFTVFKWELKYVVYANGVKESFENSTAPANANSAKSVLTIEPTINGYYYNNQKISEKKMLDVAWKLQDKKVDAAIDKTEKERFNKNCFIVAGGALAVAGLFTYAGLISAPGTRVNNYTIGGGGSRRRAQNSERLERARVGGTLLLTGISCEIVSLVFTIHEKQYAHIVADLYNRAILL